MSTTNAHRDNHGHAAAFFAATGCLTHVARALRRLALNRRLSQLEATIERTACEVRRTRACASYLELERQRHACETYCIERAILQARLEYRTRRRCAR